MTDALFEGRLVTLRAFEPGDAAAIEGYLNHPALIGRRYIPWSFSDTLPLSSQQVGSIVQKWGETEKGLVLAIVRPASGQVVGHAEGDWDWDPHNPSVSIVIDPAQQRQGYGSEALALVIRYLFDHTPAHSVTAWIADWNHEGRRLAGRHGFQDSGRMRRAGLRQGVGYDLVITGLLRREWHAATRERGVGDAP